MDHSPSDALPVAPSVKNHNNPELSPSNKDTNNNKNNSDNDDDGNNNNKNYNLNKTNSERSKDPTSENNFPCNPRLMSQTGCDKVTISSSSSSSGSTTRKPKTVTCVTSDTISSAVLGTIESQPSPRASSISEPAVTTTTAAHHPSVSVTTTTTTNTARSSTRLVSEESCNSSSFGSSNKNNNNNNNKNNNKNNCSIQLQPPGSTDVTPKQDAEFTKTKPEVPPTGNDSSGVNPSDDSRSQDSCPLTRKDGEAENNAAVGKQELITEQISKAAVIAPPQEESSTPSFASSDTPSPVALAVAPIPPRTTEGNYSVSSKTRHAGISSVRTGNENQTVSPPASEAATTTTTTTTASATTSAATTTTTTEGSIVKVSNEKDPGRESAQQKLVVPKDSVLSDERGILKGPPSAAGQLCSKNSEIISKPQEKQQQEQLPMNKGSENEGEEKKTNKEVLEGSTAPSPPPSSSSSSSTLLPPPSQEGELNQPATTTATTTTTTTTTTTDSAVASIHHSLSPRSELVSHPKSGPVVPYTNSSSSSSSSSSVLSTTIPASAPLSSYSLLVGKNKQPLSLSVTSAKYGCVSFTETSPTQGSVQRRNTTTTTTAASCRNALTILEQRADSLTSTMCGPSEDKVMTNSSGETSGSTTNRDSTKTQSPQNIQSTTTTTTVTGQTFLSLSPNFSSAATPIVITCLNSINNTSSVKTLMAPNVDSTLKEEETAVAALLSDPSPVITSSFQSLHESSPSPLSSSSSSFTSQLPTPSISPTLTSKDKKHKIMNSISATQDNPLKRSCLATGTKAASTEGSAVSGNSSIHSIQSSPKLGVDSPDSFVALPQTGFESSEFEENTEDSNSNTSGHVGLNSAYEPHGTKDSDCAFDNNISNVERQREGLVSENTCDMEYDPLKSYYNDHTNGTSSKDFRFKAQVYRSIYDSYDCKFSVQNKDVDDHLLQTPGNKMCSTSSGFVNNLLRCTTAIADDHSYCWSVSKTQETESLLRDAHPCDDETSDSSSLDDIPGQQESLSFLAQNTFSKTSKSKVQNQRNNMTLGGAVKKYKNNSTFSTMSPTNNTFGSNSATKFLVDLPSTGHNHSFDQKSDDDRKVNGLLTPVKYTDNNSVSLTSPKVTPLKGLGSRGSLQTSPKVGCCYRIGTFGSISNMDWDENSDTSSSVGSLSLSEKSREKFTYCQKDNKPEVPKSLMSLGEHYKKSDAVAPGSGRRHLAADTNARLARVLHDHDYCIRTTISPMKSELAKELLSGSKHVSCSSKYSNANSSKGSNSSSNSLISFSSSSSSSSFSPLSVSYTGISPVTAPSSTEVKCIRKGRNNSATKFADGSEHLQESPLSEKADDSSKISDPNCEAAQSNESKLKITGSFQNDYVYFLNKTTRSRRRFSHEILPDKNLKSINYSDIVIPHLTDADIEALKNKRSHNNNQAADVAVWKSSQDTPGELEADNRLMNTVFSMDSLCPDPGSEHGLPELIDSTVVPDNLAANPEQYLTPEEMDILFNAVKEVQSTNFKDLNPASMLKEDQINPCLADVSNHKTSTDSVDVSAMGTSQTDIPVSQWSGCNSTTDELTKSEVLTTNSNLLDLEYIPMNDINPIIGASSDKFKVSHLSCPPGADLPSSDLNALCANNSSSGLTDVHMSSLEKFDLLNLKSDLFPEPAITDTSISEGNAPWIVTVTMFWNDLPAIMIDNQPYIRLVDIHKQILPAKDTGILKKRCQLLGVEVLNCTEFQRYFLVQYGRAYNSKSTLVISKDDAKILIGYYVNPPTRIPKGEGCEDEPASPGKRITKTNGSLEGRIKKHGRLMGSRKQSIHKLNKDKVNGEKLDKIAELQQPSGDQKDHPAQQSSSAQLNPGPRPIKVKRVSKERRVLSASMNGKARLRHKKINFLNLIRGETGTSSSSATAAATIATPTSSSSDPTLPMLDFVNTIDDHPENASIDTSIDMSTPAKHQQPKWVIDGKCKSGLKRISASQKMAVDGVQDLRRDVGGQENGKIKQCNGRIGLPSVARDHPVLPATGGPQKKKQKNTHQKQFSAFSAVTGKLQPIAKWKNSRNALGGHGKTNQRKVKRKSKTVTAAATAISNGDNTDKMPRLCPTLLVYHVDEVPESDRNPCVQFGKLFLSLYSAKNAKCIKCTTCAKVFSVDEFLQHQHLNPNANSELVIVSSAQSLRLRDDTNESHQLLWKNFLLKRDQFNLKGSESSRLSPPLRTAGAGVKGPVNSLSSSSAPATIMTAAVTSLSAEMNGGNQKSNSTYRVSSRKRKQKQFYPIENYDFKRLPGSVGHGKDSSTLNQFGQWGGKARRADSQSNFGCSTSKKALTVPNSGSFPSYGLSIDNSTGNRDGGSLSKNVVTLTNEPELLSFTALENDEEYM